MNAMKKGSEEPQKTIHNPLGGCFLSRWQVGGGINRSVLEEKQGDIR
jgi:hypothetical protein